jgi:hypothetical protein
MSDQTVSKIFMQFRILQSSLQKFVQQAWMSVNSLSGCRVLFKDTNEFPPHIPHFLIDSGKI